jgi:hypothetical protein
MKTVFLIFCLGLLSVMHSCKDDSGLEIGQKTTMKIDREYDAKEVVKGEIIKAKFKIENTGKYPLVFGEVRPSCGCTVAKKPEAPILPGKTGYITAEVDTKDFDRGKQIKKYVTVMANTKPNIVQLKITAKIK